MAKTKRMDEGMALMLSVAEKRRLGIVQTLFQANGWVEIEKLAKQVSCSTKTIESDFKFFEAAWKKFFTIEVNKKLGARLHLTHSSKLECVYSDILQNSQLFQFSEMLFFKPFEIGNAWVRELFISESSFYRMIQTLNLALGSVGIEIIRQPLYIRGGDERWVRLHFSNYFHQAYRNESWPFEKINKQNLVILFQKIFEAMNIELSDEKVLGHVYSAATTLTRLSQGFKSTRKKNNEHLESLFLEHSDLVQQGLDFKLPQDWNVELAQTVAHPIYGWDNDQEEMNISEAVAHFIESISEQGKMEIEDFDKEQIIYYMIRLYTKHKMFPYIRFTLFDNFRFQSEQITKNYPNFSEVISVNLKEIEKKTGFPWYSKMRYHVFNIFFTLWEDLPLKLEKRRKKVNILILSMQGKQHAYMLKHLLDMQFHFNVNMDVFEGSLLNQLEFPSTEDYHMVISNAHVKGIAPSKLYTVDNVPTVSQISMIAETVGRLQLKIHKKSPEPIQAIQTYL